MQFHPFGRWGPEKLQPRIRPQAKDLLMEEKRDQAHEHQALEKKWLSVLVPNVMDVSHRDVL